MCAAPLDFKILCGPTMNVILKQNSITKFNILYTDCKKMDHLKKGSFQWLIIFLRKKFILLLSYPKMYKFLSLSL